MSGPESVGIPFEKLFATGDGGERIHCGEIFLGKWIVFTESGVPTSIAYGKDVSLTYDSKLDTYLTTKEKCLTQIVPIDYFGERENDITWEEVKRILEIMESHHQFCLEHEEDSDAIRSNLLKSLRRVEEVFPSKFEGRENYSPRIIAECPKCDRMVNVGMVLAEDDFNIAYDGTEAYEIDCPYCRALFEAKFAVEVVGTRLVKTDPGGE